jgi:hypothetical protein
MVRLPSPGLRLTRTGNIMITLWTETKTDAEARALDRAMWEITGMTQPDGTFTAQAAGPAPENGQFWYDELTRIKHDPDQRYALARRHLPLPAAWREMAIALRTKIRKARKEKADYEGLLLELHHLAALDSYAGYGIIQRVPYARLASLDLSYDRVGCDRLALLGVTDCKWMRELWGEPGDHSTASELYGEMYETDLARIKADEEQEGEGRSERFLDEFVTRHAPTESPKPKGFFAKLFGW